MAPVPLISNGSNGKIGTSSKKRVAIIGAGVSGILSIKACKEEEEFFEELICYEKTSHPGGLWKYRDLENELNNNEFEKFESNNNKFEKFESNNNKFEKFESNNIPTVMEGTVANSSKEMSAFSDFPPSPKTPNYMHHKVMLNYIQSYAENFDCIKHIKFNHEIEEISRVSNKWKISLIDHSNSSTTHKNEFFDIVMICTGHHGRPFVPKFSGQNNFKGKIIHTQNYKRADKFRGEKVLIVGVGNSGLDAAVELSNVAEEVYLSTRSGCWILPRAGFRGGRPYDTSFLRRSMHLMKDGFSTGVASYVMETLLNRRFDHELYGLRPAHPLFFEHPTVNDQLHSKIISGRVIVKGDVERLTEKGVLFEGEQKYEEDEREKDEGEKDEGEKDEVEIDSIILATGYHVEYPFLSKQLRSQIMEPTSNSVNLYKYVFPVNMTDDPDMMNQDNEGDSFTGLGFIGVPNALGPLFPIAEIQTRWFVQVAIGNSFLPTTSLMQRQLKVQEMQRKKKFTDTPRHGVQVEWIPYLDEIAEELGVKPDLWKLFINDRKLWSRLYFGPSVPYQYRLTGPHSWEDAREAIMKVSDRIEAPFKTSSRLIRTGKDQVSVNPLYANHNFLYKIIFAVIGAFLFDMLFFWAP